MEINWVIIGILVVVVIVLIAFITKKNQKEKKKLTDLLNNDFKSWRTTNQNLTIRQASDEAVISK